MKFIIKKGCSLKELMTKSNSLKSMAVQVTTCAGDGQCQQGSSIYSLNSRSLARESYMELVGTRHAEFMMISMDLTRKSTGRSEMMMQHDVRSRFDKKQMTSGHLQESLI